MTESALGSFNDFVSSFFLWRDAIIASSVVALLCGWLGIYVVLKRIVFVSAALPQISGLGIAFAFFIGSFVGAHGHSEYFFFNPLFMAVCFGCGAALLYSTATDHRKLSHETLIGITYVLGSAFVLQILSSPRIVQEAHEIGDILFGNAVVVDPQILYAIILATVLLLTIHFLFFKEFVSVSFDPEMAATLGMKVHKINWALHLTIAIAISTATRAIGALPVFGFMVIPPAAALMLTKGLKTSILLSMVIGVISAFIGYYLSFVFSLPTGATMVVVMGLWLIPGVLKIQK